jgi:hypothetical protein
MQRLVLFLIWGLAVVAPDGARAADAAAVDGTWQRHDTVFTYTGQTSHYSCDALENKMRTLLRLAGARPGYRVVGACAERSRFGPQITTVRLSFAALAPAGGAGAGANAGTAAARGEWRAVDWRPRAPRELEAGDCELVAQFAQQILPLFTTRAVENRVVCVPHAVSLSGIELRFSVLAALPPADAETAKAP